jgi:hypothetical protein
MTRVVVACVRAVELVLALDQPVGPGIPCKSVSCGGKFGTAPTTGASGGILAIRLGGWVGLEAAIVGLALVVITSIR